MEAIFTYNIYGYCVRIPKRNGKGYLVSATGGHHNSEAYQKLNDLLPSFVDWAKGIADIDGYLDIPIKTDCTIEDSTIKAYKINEVIVKVFPHIEKITFVEWNKFFNMLTNKE